MATAMTVNMVHLRTGLSFSLRVPKGTTIHEIKMGLNAVIKKRIGRDARIDAPNDIIVFQDNRQCSKVQKVECLQCDDDYVVLRYIMKSDFEAEAGDYTPEPMASSTSASDHPSDGLCLLSQEVGNFEGYKVFFMDGSGDALVSTHYGSYAIDLNEFCRDHNVLIIHDNEDYKEELIGKLMHFLMHEVAPQMIINVLSQEGMDITQGDFFAGSTDDFKTNVAQFLKTKDIQKLKFIHARFDELLLHCHEDADDSDVYEETDFASTAVPVSDAVIEDDTTQTAVSESAEPEDEPTAMGWTLVLEFTVANINQHVDLNISPDANLSSLRKRIAEVVFANNPKKTQKLMSGKDLVLTALNPERAIGIGNVKVKTVLTDGRHVRVAFRALGGGKSAKAKGVKKDAGGKTTRYGQMMQDANSKIQMETIKDLPFIAKAEQVMTGFSNAVEQNPEEALLKVFMTMPMEKINSSIQVLNQKGGKMEAKIGTIAIDVFDLGQVVASKTSLESVIDASSAVFLYGISKLGANDTRNEAQAVKSLLERALYIKQGQQSMGGYSTEPVDADL